MIRKATSVFISALALVNSAIACPRIGGIPDFNCDQELNVTVIGDSLVSGFGDTQNGNQGGYVLRADRKIAAVSFSNQGVAGLKTRELLTILNDAFTKDKFQSLVADLRKADIVILDLGRNDRWLFLEPDVAYRNLKRAAGVIKGRIKKLEGASPLVVKAVLMLPNRGSQGPWVKALNDLILKSDSNSDPANLRFDLVSKRLLSTDQIHPLPAGYAALAKTFVKYLTRTLPPRMLALRPDADHDDIFDLFEPLRFGTDATVADTDGDGQLDGVEVFELGTDPLVAG